MVPIGKGNRSGCFQLVLQHLVVGTSNDGVVKIHIGGVEILDRRGLATGVIGLFCKAQLIGRHALRGKPCGDAFQFRHNQE